MNTLAISHCGHFFAQFIRRLVPLVCALLATSPGLANVSLVAPGAVWKYLDNGSNQGIAWRAAAFDDGAWAFGASELGYGDADEATVVSYGPNASAKFVTTYFRYTFTVANPAAFNSLALRLLRDDGAVIYLNGVEVRRDNMPTGAISYTTLAVTALGVPAEATFYETTLAPSALAAGTNVLTVEIHQANGTSTDISFNLELIGVDTQTITRGPYLQNGTPDSVVVRWRTNAATDSYVRYGTDPATLNLTASSAAATTEHEVALTGMAPDTRYYYSTGSSTAVLASGLQFNFFTAPPVGTAHATRIWVLGDSGTADAVAAGVRNGYSTFTGTSYTDVWLMLGDNAYDAGTDAEYQAAVFDMYPGFLRQSVLWSTIGNHDTASSTNPPLTIPYFNIFTLPTNGEAGGLPSGTEKYYSFDYGRIHFICLDSMTSSRAAGSPMLTWLQTDLESTAQDWLIAFWHHPPYSKGSHDSDTDTQLKEMRTNILPLLEAAGVDLVLAGHSHCYERSYLINGHYGLSTTFDGSMKLNGGSGREDGSGAYTKPAGLPAHQGTVYAVAGNGGQISSWVGGSTSEFNPSPHPAMFYSALHTGSMVLDVNGNRLDAKMIRENGSVDDYFTIIKNLPNQPPSVTITAPAADTVFTAPATITISADASDSDGTVAQVDFYAGATVIGSATTSPFSVTWNNVAAGNYALTAAATDNLGATTSSAAVNITVNPPPPDAPANLTATGGNAMVTLTWSAVSGATGYNVKRATASGGPYSLAAGGLSTTGYSDTAVSNGTAYFYVVSAINAGGESPNSPEATATPAAPPPPNPPAGLAATAGNAQVSLTWSASAGATGYNVKRATVSGGPYNTIAGISVTTYTDTTVSNGTTYYYVVTANNTSGESAASNETSATPTAPITIPAAPSSLAATAASRTLINLTWTDNANNESGYQIERSTNGSTFAQIATTGPDVNTFSSTGLSANKKYFFRVRAFNAAGSSVYSNTVTAKTPK